MDGAFLPGVLLTTRRQTRTSTWPGPGTRMSPSQRTSKISTFSSDYTSCARQQEVCSLFESLSKTARVGRRIMSSCLLLTKAELEMQKGRRVGHFQKSLQELAELEVWLLLLLLFLLLPR